MAAPPSAREHTLRSLVPSAAPRAWQPCRRHRGQPLTDADGQVLKAGLTVVNSKFGEGIARGTVPLEKNDGVTRANRRQQCWKATEPWHREPEAGVRYSLVGSSVYMRWVSKPSGFDREDRFAATSVSLRGTGVRDIHLAQELRWGGETKRTNKHTLLE